MLELLLHALSLVLLLGCFPSAQFLFKKTLSHFWHLCCTHICQPSNWWGISGVATTGFRFPSWEKALETCSTFATLAVFTNRQYSTMGEARWCFYTGASTPDDALCRRAACSFPLDLSLHWGGGMSHFSSLLEMSINSSLRAIGEALTVISYHQGTII